MFLCSGRVALSRDSLCGAWGRALLLASVRATLSYMKASTVTIRLDTRLQRELDRLCKQLGRSRSEVVRDALRRQIALLRFQRSRQAILPLAEAQGILTDEDVFRIVS
jgi:predicted transcriptional regulator